MLQPAQLHPLPHLHLAGLLLLLLAAQQLEVEAAFAFAAVPFWLDALLEQQLLAACSLVTLLEQQLMMTRILPV